MNLFGIEWVGVNAENGRKLLLSLAFVAVEIVVALDQAGIGIASATYDIVAFPPVELRPATHGSA